MSKPFNLSLVWLRRDLRLEDNTALSEAMKRSDQVALAFVFDTNILNKITDKNDRRISFIFESLKELNDSLEKKQSQLIIRVGNPISEIPKLVKEIKADALFFNEDYEGYAKKRDKVVKSTLLPIQSFSFKDQVIFSGKEVLKPNGDAYQMFTPYKRTWLKQLKSIEVAAASNHTRFIKSSLISKFSKPLNLDHLGFNLVKQYYPFQKAGQKNARSLLKKFKNSLSLEKYSVDRDYPALEHGTSGLSTHLRFGTISIRECVNTCLSNYNKGAQTWLSELIWREFYSMILDQYPHVQTGCFKKQFDQIKWPKNRLHFLAWCKGQTGYPIIDAGMRQLNQTGWMHNRVRMIVASFLVKDLQINWQLGEKYFADHLLDFDFASNNGGWQWCASTGCDAQPYFRIFNPSLQSKRFDPEAEYIKRWVPELISLTAKEIHNPEKSNLNLKAKYPKPIVGHSAQKLKTLRLYSIK